MKSRKTSKGNKNEKKQVKPTDRTDPVCGMQGHIPAHGHYFCSKACAEKYGREVKVGSCSSCRPQKQTRWYRDRLFLVAAFAAIVLVVSYYIGFMRPFFTAFSDYVGMIWWALLIGFLLGGVIDRYVPAEYIKRYLSAHRKRSVVYAVVFGFLMSACSHGILAIAIELHRKGASTSSVVAFLLASPWANLPVTILLFGFFGLNALYIVISAIVVAVITGLIFQVLEKRGLVETRETVGFVSGFSIRKDISRRFRGYAFTGKNIWNDFRAVMKGSWSLTRMVMWWIIIGMLLASLAAAFVPHDIFMTFLGPSVLGMFLTLALATIIEVCSEGSSPLAFEIFRQTGAFGNSFVFLMSGVSTDYTEIGLLWSNVGKRTAILIPIITVPQILLLGFLFNMFL